MTHRLPRSHRPLRRMAAAILSLAAAAALASCVADDAGGPQGKTLTEAERADCLMRGGTTGTGGLFPDELCFMPMQDAGKSCTKAGDCDGICLAEAKTCSTVSPIFGCYDYLDEQGRIVGICVD